MTSPKERHSCLETRNSANISSFSLYNYDHFVGVTNKEYCINLECYCDLFQLVKNRIKFEELNFISRHSFRYWRA